MLYVWMEASSVKTRALKDLIYVKSRSIYSVRIPHGYCLVSDKEGKAINIAHKNEKDYYLFLATLNMNSVLDT